MNISRELDPMPEHRRQLAFKSKQEHITKVKLPNIYYPNQYVNTEIPHSSRDHVVLPDTVNLRLILALN